MATKAPYNKRPKNICPLDNSRLIISKNAIIKQPERLYDQTDKLNHEKFHQQILVAVPCTFCSIGIHSTTHSYYANNHFVDNTHSTAVVMDYFAYIQKMVEMPRLFCHSYYCIFSFLLHADLCNRHDIQPETRQFRQRAPHPCMVRL